MNMQQPVVVSVSVKKGEILVSSTLRDALKLKIGDSLRVYRLPLTDAFNGITLCIAGFSENLFSEISTHSGQHLCTDVVGDTVSIATVDRDSYYFKYNEWRNKNHTTSVEFEHRYQINDIIELKNTNNEKSVFCKVVNVEFNIIDGNSSISTTDIIKTTKCGKFTYKVYYNTVTVENSYYDTLEIKEYPIDNILVLNLE
jgi:hypothetical protein